MAGARHERIGIFGGTLDPIHVGHVQAALAAREALDLDRVVVMPSRTPPHRQGPAASPFHRFAMTALAINDLTGLCVSDEEISAQGPSYTALTLERMTAAGLQRARLFFITGADAFAEIESWYRYPAVLDLSHFVVVSRPGARPAAVLGRVPALRERIRTARDLSNPSLEPSVFLVDAATPDVSSTEIRRRLRAGEGIGGLVPRAVETYIERQRLYMDTQTADHTR